VGRLTHESELQQPARFEEEGTPTTVVLPESVASEPAPSRRWNLTQWLFWFFAFALTATLSATIGAALVLMAPISPAIAPQTDGYPLSLKDVLRKSFGYRITRPVNILVMGIDRVPEAEDGSLDLFAGRSDTMLLVQVDPDTNTASVLSIPRDTQVHIPRVGIHKINHANLEGGADLAAQVVSRNLNGVTIDRYVRISTEAFRELIDLVGGVEVFVPQRMQYDDNTQDLHIDLQPGWQVLNGDQAEQFARFRRDGYGDVGRVQRQQQLLRALRDRLTSPTVIPKLPAAVELFQDYIDTNLSLDEMLALVNFGLNLEQDSFRMVMLPGRFSNPDEYIASYWIIDLEGRDQVMQEYFAIGPLGLVAAASRDFNHLRIAVQNATGEPELGRHVADYLQEHGFDNVYLIQDWPDHQQQTQIIAQRGDLHGAAMLESVLGVGDVVAASTGDLQSDLTIRVGSDWFSQSDI
jgi:LCP family protein required for cell wall assembly